MATAITAPALTRRQAAIYRFLGRFVGERGYPPTVREIGEQFAIRSPNGVMCHLRALTKKGYIQHEPGKSRTITLLV